MMASNSQLYDNMGKVRELVSAKLDDLDGVLPQVKPPRVPFQDYMLRAVERAQRDPVFADKFKRAVEEWQTLGGSVKNA